MTKNILIVFLCFTLLFVAFNPSALSNASSIYDELDGSRQIIHLGTADWGDSYPVYSGDYLIDYEELYVVDYDILSFQNIEGPLRGYFVENSTLQSMSDDFYKNIYDFISHYYENWDLYFNCNSADEYDLCYPFALDGKIEFFHSMSDPHSSVKNIMHPEYAGDFWYNTTFKKCYVYDGFSWQEIDYESLEKYSTYHGYNEVLDASFDQVDYNEVFDFGYELTIGTLEVATSIFRGSDEFFSRFDRWKSVLFKDVNIIEFIFDLFDRIIKYAIDWIGESFNLVKEFVDKLPIIGPLSRFVDSCLDVFIGFIQNVIAPLEDVFGDLSKWIRDKLN